MATACHCPAGSTVTLFAGDTEVGTAIADGNGHFQSQVLLASLPIGRQIVVAKCGSQTLQSKIDLVSTTANGGGGNGTVAVLLAFFILIGAVLFQAPMMDRRRRNRI